MEYWHNILCISAQELAKKGVVSLAKFYDLVKRGDIRVVSEGRRGQAALAVVDSLPLQLRLKLEGIESSNKTERVKRWLMANYYIDTYASGYFGKQKLPLEAKMEYIAEASMLSVCLELYHDDVQWKKLMGKKFDWKALAQAVEELSKDYLYRLPYSPSRLREKMRAFDEDLYASLISGKYGNQNAKK